MLGAPLISNVTSWYAMYWLICLCDLFKLAVVSLRGVVKKFSVWQHSGQTGLPITSLLHIAWSKIPAGELVC